MVATQTPNQPGEPRAAGDYTPRVVVKFREGPPAAVAALAAQPGGGEMPRGLEALRGRFPGIRAERLIQSVSPARLQSMMREVRRSPVDDHPTPDLTTFYSVVVPRGTDPAAVVAAAGQLQGVEMAYLQGGPTPPPVSPADDPLSTSQGHLNAAPQGVDIRHAWTLRGGDGAGVGFVDLEQGWILNHRDLPSPPIRIISGVNHSYQDHGTRMLGTVVAQDNTILCIGETPMATARVVSQHRPGGAYSTSDAITSAVSVMARGDVLLLEAQTTIQLRGGTTSPLLPVEVEADVFAAIRNAVCHGIIVVEAAGNGGTDLDTVDVPGRGFCLNEGHRQFRQSGAILVGSATSAVPHERMRVPAGRASNFGTRIDCYGWGQNIVTLAGPGTGDTTPDSGGTSGASAMTAGVCVSLQGIVKARGGPPWTPAKMRAVLRAPRNGTPSRNPATDRIGCMPNLRAIIAAERLAAPARPGATTPAPAPARPPRPVGDFPLPVGDTRVAALIDAGHGGEEEAAVVYAGGESPGVEGRINLGIARSVRAYLGDAAALTRDGDYPLPLQARTRQARGTEAPVFVSIHANTGRTDRPGPEVWVYGGPAGAADAESRALAGRISAELARLDGAPVPVRAGDLALLRPRLHGAGRAACLVEAGSLAHAHGAARLRDARAQEAIGAAVARGVSGYLADGGPRYGGTELLEAPATAAEPWRTEGEAESVPAQACFHALAEPEQANWWDTPGMAAALDAAPAAVQPLLAYHQVSWPTFAPHEGAFYTALTEHLRRAGVLAPGAPALTQATCADALREFQRRNRLTVNGLADAETLWALQHDWAVARRLGVTRVTADQVPRSGGYTSFRVRGDIVERYNALRAAVLAAGGRITSAGSMRELTAQVTPGRSPTSIHYSGLAIDLATDTGMRNPAREQYVVTQDGQRWRVWCRSDAAPEQTLDAVVWARGATRTQQVRARAFDFTALAERHGFARIGPRSSFPANYLSAEWWHFQCEAVLTPFVSQFGIELLSLASLPESILRRHTAIWANRTRVFKSMRSGGWH